MSGDLRLGFTPPLLLGPSPCLLGPASPGLAGLPVRCPTSIATVGRPQIGSMALPSAARHLLPAALRGAPAAAASWAGLRGLRTSGASAHVQAAQEEEAAPATGTAGRWRSELGAVRTDWT